MKTFLGILALISVVQGRAAQAANSTLCSDSTMGAFSLETDSSGKITAGSIGLIYKNYRKCDLTQDNTRVVKEFDEYLLKGECVGSAKLVYDRINRIVYAIEPEQNRKIAISRCSSFSYDADPQRLVFESHASVTGQSGQQQLEKEVVDQLLKQAEGRCVTAGFAGHARRLSALATSYGPAGHFGDLMRASAESIFACD